MYGIDWKGYKIQALHIYSARPYNPTRRSQGWHQEAVPGLPVPAWQQSAYETDPCRNQDLSAKEGQKEIEPAWILPKTPIRNLLIKKTYTRLMRLSEVSYHPINSLFHSWGNREHVNILSWVSLLTLRNSMLHLKRSSADTLQPQDTQDTHQWFITAANFFFPNQTKLGPAVHMWESFFTG